MRILNPAVTRDLAAGRRLRLNVGGGKRALPKGVREEVSLVDSRRFANGTVHLHYRAHYA